MAARSLQALARAAVGLGVAASSSLACATALAGLRATAATAAGPAAAVQQAAAAAVGLRQLARHFHVVPPAARAAAEDMGAAAPTPALNPLQQAPTPASALGAPTEFIRVMGDEGPVARAVARGLRISPQKLNDFAKVVRGLPIQDALIQCEISPKKAAGVVHKLLLQAKANAVTNAGLMESHLRVAEAWVGKGQHLKRVSLHGRGRSGQRLRYRSHLTVVLREEEQEPRRRTRILPQLQERQRWLRVREAGQQRQQQQAAAA